ncbi:hypothetical protein GGR21_000108 [Dysgonomonas hofstadii]|uniref:BACON domain-containing protein n=1 Tax=Dysgonomonas hofstadii TaxID=637886 RepID=A0A840CR51_9BACT|nr:BACON domain-containing protein [Dysgonomonas hofstadii]MBB4034223.1 hypothetical protein [Dysgonomonas hofstadii]
MRKSIFAKLSMAFALALLIGFVGCNREDIDYEQPVLEINKTQLEFDELGVAVDNNDSFTIQTNREWSISVPDAASEWVRISKSEGEGSQTISVTVLSNAGEPRSAKLKVSSSINYEYIDIIQSGALAATPIYNEKVGDSVEKTNDSWPYADQFTGWSRGGSLDQSAVTYGGSGANVSNSGAAFQPADGSAITGAPYVGLNYSGGNQRTFTISKINVSESSNLRLKFASLFQSDYSGGAQFGEINDQSFQVSGSLDGSAWTELTYSVSKDPAGGSWYILTSEFKVPEGATELYLKFDATPQSNQGYRIDDIKLTREGTGQTEIGGGVIPPTGAILSENVGDTEVAANTQVDAFTGWLKSGSGASGVTYAGSAKTDVRKSVVSSGYTGATGGNNIFFGSEDNGTFEIKDIDVTGKTQLTFSFGISWQANYPDFSAVDNNTIKLSASIDGTNYTTLTFSNAATAGWVLATSEFKVPSGTTKLYIKFADPAAKSQIRLDDFTLEEGGSGTTVIGGGTTPAGAILSDNMGDTEVAANTQVDAFTGWLKSGSGASGVTYTGSAKTDVRKSVASSGYTGASGGNNIFFGSEDNGTFEIKNIDVTGKTQLSFSFGISWQSAYPDFSSIDNNTIKLSASIDGTSYTDLTFSNAATAGWVLATSEFKIPSGTTKLYIKFADPAAKSQVRLDDFTLAEGGSGQTEIGSGGSTPQLTFGNPAFSGTMTAGTALSGAKITIPYSNAKAESFTVNVAISGTGAAGIDAVTAKNVVLGTGSGNVELDIAGTPTTAGDVVFTITGLTGLATTTVNATVQSGGSSGGDFSALWDMTGIPAWGDSPMNATDVTGSGVTVGGLTKEGFTISGTPGNNNWGGVDFSANAEGISLSAPEKYAYFTVTSTSSFSISSLEATIRLTKTGPTKTSVQYSIDGGAYAQAGAIELERPTATKTFPKETVDLSGVSALQNISSGKTVTIRLVPVATEGTTTGNWYLTGAEALSINGSTN